MANRANDEGTDMNPTHATQQVALEAESIAIEAAMRTAAEEAVRQHQRLGLPLVEWHDGRVVLVPADEIVLDPPTIN